MLAKSSLDGLVPVPITSGENVHTKQSLRVIHAGGREQYTLRKWVGYPIVTITDYWLYVYQISPMWSLLHVRFTLFRTKTSIRALFNINWREKLCKNRKDITHRLARLPWKQKDRALCRDNPALSYFLVSVLACIYNRGDPSCALHGFFLLRLWKAFFHFPLTVSTQIQVVWKFQNYAF